VTGRSAASFPSRNSPSRFSPACASVLDLPPREGPQDILVVESEGRCFGLLVDGVGEVLVVSPEDYEPNPSTIDEKKRKFFAGACKLREGLMVVLDPARLDPMRLAKAS
jgi:purine-binding chemotaxis protein CheW